MREREYVYVIVARGGNPKIIVKIRSVFFQERPMTKKKASDYKEKRRKN